MKMNSISIRIKNSRTFEKFRNLNKRKFRRLNSIMQFCLFKENSTLGKKLVEVKRNQEKEKAKKNDFLLIYYLLIYKLKKTFLRIFQKNYPILKSS